MMSISSLLIKHRLDLFYIRNHEFYSIVILLDDMAALSYLLIGHISFVSTYLFIAFSYGL